jgi:hypothetical protein
VVSLEHQLHGAADVLDGDEPELAVPSHGHHAPGHPGDLAGSRVRRQVAVGRLQLGQRRPALEPGRVRVDALGLQRVALGPAFGGLGRQAPKAGGRLGCFVV